MKPIALGLGLLITVAAGGAMLLSSGNSGSGDSNFDKRAERVMGSRGRRSPQQGIANATSGRTMFRSVEAWGSRDRSRFAADAPSRMRATDRLRAGNDATSVVPNARQGIRPSNRDPAVATTTRPAPGVRPGRGADARRQSMQERVRQRELDVQQRRLQMQEGRLRRLQEARQRSARMAVNNPRGGGLINALNSLAAGDSPGSLGGDTNSDGSPRDPNAPPSMDEIMGLFEAFGIDPNSGGTTTTGNFGGTGSSGTGNTGGRTGSGFNTNNTGSSGGSSGGGGDPFFNISGNGGGTNISLVWIPVDNTDCDSTRAGFRTNDLYIRLASDLPVLTVNSDAITGLALEGGAFFKVDGASLIINTFITSTTDPCLAFDSALNNFGLFDRQSIRIDTRLVAIWLNFSGVNGKQNPDLFGDSAFYVRLGRFTAPTSITNISGVINIFAGALGSSLPEDFDVPFSPELWREDFELISPIEEKQLTDITPTLDWEAVGNDEVIYIVRIAEDTNDNGIPDTAILEETLSPAVSPALPAPAPAMFQVPLGTLNYKLTYTWFIEAQFSEGDPIFSDTRQFRTPACLGDANYSGEVDFDDFTAVISNLGNKYLPLRSGPGDADNSGFVDSLDMDTVLFHFGKTCPTSP